VPRLWWRLHPTQRAAGETLSFWHPCTNCKCLHSSSPYFVDSSNIFKNFPSCWDGKVDQAIWSLAISDCHIEPGFAWSQISCVIPFRWTRLWNLQWPKVSYNSSSYLHGSKPHLIFSFFDSNAFCRFIGQAMTLNRWNPKQRIRRSLSCRLFVWAYFLALIMGHYRFSYGDPTGYGYHAG